MAYGDPSYGPGSPGSILGSGSDRVRVLDTATLTGSTQLTTLPGKLMGYNVQETTGAAAARVRIFDGTDTSGQRVAGVSVPSGDSKDASFFDMGVDIKNGLFIAVVSGSVDVTCYYRMDVSGNG
jgi:hypothetical protein